MPDVRRFVLDPGNADSYMGLKINFIPHHPPEFVMFDDQGEDLEVIDMSTYSFDGLTKLFDEKGLKKKDLL